MATVRALCQYSIENPQFEPSTNVCMACSQQRFRVVMKIMHSTARSFLLTGNKASREIQGGGGGKYVESMYLLLNQFVLAF